MQPEEIHKAYAERRKQKNLATGIMAGTVLLFLLVTLIVTSTEAYGALIVAFVVSGLVGPACIIRAYRVYRCPFCEKALGRNTTNHCSHCGTRLVP